jgi:hypothetical protein
MTGVSLPSETTGTSVEKTKAASKKTVIKKTVNKKDSQLIIRINGSERETFVSLCEALDTSAAREIRKFIRVFIKENLK